MNKLSTNIARVAKNGKDRTDLLMSAVVDSMSWSRFPCGKSVVVECGTVTETAVRLNWSASPHWPTRNEVMLKPEPLSALSVVDRSRTWSRLFSLKVAEVRI